MGQILHGCARTTEAVRWEIQNNKESVKALSERLGLNYKTVSKWKHRNFVHDMPMGPKILILQYLRAKRRPLVSRSQALFAAFRRLPVRSERTDSAPHALVATSAFSTQRNQQTA